MLKVHIQYRCEHCNGEAYLPVAEAEDVNGDRYLRYAPCPHCEGSGMNPKWISLEDLVALLQQAQCQHTRTFFQGSFHYNGGDVWDDIQEVCIDCGADLD